MFGARAPYPVSICSDFELHGGVAGETEISEFGDFYRRNIHPTVSDFNKSPQTGVI